MRGLIDYQEISAGCHDSDSATGTHDSMSLAFNPLLITYVVTWSHGPSAYPAKNRAGSEITLAIPLPSLRCSDLDFIAVLI